MKIERVRKMKNEIDRDLEKIYKKISEKKRGSNYCYKTCNGCWWKRS